MTRQKYLETNFLNLEMLEKKYDFLLEKQLLSNITPSLDKRCLKITSKIAKMRSQCQLTNSLEDCLHRERNLASSYLKKQGML